VPFAWKVGIVKPIFKGGSREEAANYRPICLTSVVCKVLERIVKQHLQVRLETFISPKQHGFQKSRSCISNLLTAREKWAEILDSDRRLDVVFVDFSKAFDKVSHKQLLLKLKALGVVGNLLRWIADFLEGRTMRVQVNQSLSNSVSMTSGVPQGSVLGPELFKIYINDLPEALAADCLLYADDIKLWGAVSTVEEADLLQSSLDSLFEWSTKWNLPINYDKCSVMALGSQDPFGAYHIGGHLLKSVSQEKDLGVILKSDFTTTADTLKKVASATKMFWAIRRSFSNITPVAFRLLFSAFVRPILEYGLPACFPIWKYEKELIERVQRRSSKTVPALRDLSYDDRLSSLNLFSMNYRRLRGDLIYVRRILRGDLGEDLQQFFTLNTGSSTRGHSQKLYKPRRKHLRATFALSTRAVNVWNSLPEVIVSAPSEKRFKDLLDDHLLEVRGDHYRPWDGHTSWWWDGPYQQDAPSA
jgi:hypothetical protein